MKFDKETKTFAIILIVGWLCIGFATLLNIEKEYPVVIMLFLNVGMNIIMWLSIVHLIKKP